MARSDRHMEGSLTSQPIMRLLPLAGSAQAVGVVSWRADEILVEPSRRC